MRARVARWLEAMLIARHLAAAHQSAALQWPEADTTEEETRS